MEFKYQTVSGPIIKEIIILLLCIIIFGKACHISFFIRLVVPRPFKKCTIGEKVSQDLLLNMKCITWRPRLTTLLKRDSITSVFL